MHKRKRDFEHNCVKGDDCYNDKVTSSHGCPTRNTSRNHEMSLKCNFLHLYEMMCKYRFDRF